MAFTALCLPTPATAGEVLSVDGDRVSRVADPFAPGRASADLGAPPAGTRSEVLVQASRRQGRGPTRGQQAVTRALRRQLRARRVSRRTHNRLRHLYSRARSAQRRLRGPRARELGSVIATLEAIAIRGQLSSSRLHPVFLILRRNTEFWTRNFPPRNRDRVSFRGSELLFEYYRGRGLQIQPLLNFKRANSMHGACVKDTGERCRRDALRRLLGEMARTSSRRGGFRAWEYFFDFGGGRPPWVSGMAQATGVQALARASQLLRDRSHLDTAREALGAFTTPPPTGVAGRGPLGGPHYLQYSFAPRLFIINAFLQSQIGLYDFAAITGDATARNLFHAAEPEARAEARRSDTGDWSTYSFMGRESTREYHELLRELLAATCSRLRLSAYCDTATRFRRYTTDPAELSLLGPANAVRGQPTSVRFALSKLSAVQLTITRDGTTAFDEVLTFRRGTRSFSWTPRSAGTYSVRLAAKELRTGRGLRTHSTGEVESLP